MVILYRYRFIRPHDNRHDRGATEPVVYSDGPIEGPVWEFFT